MFTRRHFLIGSASLIAGSGMTRSTIGAPNRSLAPPSELLPGKVVASHFVAAERPIALPCFAGLTLPTWTFSEAAWLPTIRVSLGDRLDVAFENRLPRDGEHTSIHWHGIRLPNDQDGVPFLVQPPISPGESFRYSFVPPDTGTFFFHTHCNTAEQLGRGLAGVLIVDGDTVEPYAADHTILLRDWLIDFDKGTFRNFYTSRGASRAGTYGNVRSANGKSEETLRLPASTDCRLRLINGDPTRVMEIAVTDTDAAVIAIDGIAVPPFPLHSWLLAPAMRLDLVVRAPADGAAAAIVDRRLPDEVQLLSLTGTGPAAQRKPFDPLPLRAGRIPEPDLAAAERLSFVFAALGSDAPTLSIEDSPGGFFVGSLCLSAENYWTINNTAWPEGERAALPPPLAILRRGGSYVFSLRNADQLMHPIHIHGHTFKVLSSDRRDLPVHHADTVLLTPGETIDVAFVADNPGRWMFHCHVIEHQKTGMMGYVEVI